MKEMLYITAFPPNNKSGGQIFSKNAIKDLSSKYIIDLLYFTFQGHDIDDDLAIRRQWAVTPDKYNCLAYPLIFPIFTKRFSKKIAERIRAKANDYDVIYFDYSQISLYSVVIDHPMKIIRCHDVMAQRYFRKNRLLYPWVKHCEKRILKSANKIFVPSKKDQEIIKNEYGMKANYTNEYITDYAIPDTGDYTGFIMFGRWARGENFDGLKWFINKVCPLLDKKILESIVVMGGEMDEEFNRKRLSPLGIKYLGYVKDSYGEIVKHRAMIVPLFKGAGVKVKVLDSFATGTSVIGTDIAFEGIIGINRLTVRANTVREFVDAINRQNKVHILEKREAQNEFMKIYNKRHLSDFL